MTNHNRIFDIFTSKKILNSYEKKEKNYYKRLKLISQKYNVSFKDICTSVSFAKRKNFPKTLALYELFKKNMNTPGSIGEFGIYKGDSLFIWLFLLETFLPLDRKKKIYAFDHFLNYKNCTKFDKAISKNKKSFLDKVNKNMLKELILLHDSDSIFPGVKRIELIYGDILKTVPEFKARNKGVRFNILNIDFNLKRETETILEYFYDLLIPGGIIMFSGYASPPHEGEAVAIENFLKKKNNIKLKKLVFSNYPVAYFIK
jgi:hypothetical protein